ncbi:hypothetical protein WJX84_002602 [Apatococcus fuscideae]|uniref:K Homology domain-containing protein n=1 Tax=Apatococcus fuscideae TaxID=2026836 RepID=A0AAW1SR79_9CHLO
MRPSGPGHKRPAAELESASQVFSSQQTPAKRPALEQPLTFRILCPKHKVGSVIGKGGKIVSQIRRDTGARIKIEEALPSCTERIISISGPSRRLGPSSVSWSVMTLTFQRALGLLMALCRSAAVLKGFSVA